MSVEVSTLQLKVQSDGIKATATKLDNLSKSADKAEISARKATAAIDSLVQSMGALAAAQGVATNRASAHINTMQQSTRTMTGLQASSTSAAQAVQGLHQQVSQSTTAMGHSHKAGGILTNTMKSMAVAASMYIAANVSGSIFKDADAWAMMQAKLKLATGSMEAAVVVQGQLYDLAQKYRSPLDDMGKLYVRLAPAMDRLGRSSGETMDMVEGVALALKLGGATTAEASSTMLQFSQAANSGRLNGAEFNSVAENGTLILTALSQHLGKTRGELKQMGSDGKLTFDVINEAIQKVLPQWRKDFETLPLTVDGAIQRIKNAWLKGVGEMGQEGKLSANVVRLIGNIERVLPGFIDKVVTGLNFLIENADKLTAIISGLMALKLSGWMVSVAEGIGVAWTASQKFVTVLPAIATGMGGMGMATTAATTSLSLFRTAISFLGGPIGIITGLLTAGVVAWQLWGKDAPKAAVDGTKTVLEESEKRISVLDTEIKKLRERNGLAAATPTGQAQSSGGMQGLIKSLAKDVTDLDALKKAGAGWTEGARNLEDNIRKKKAQLEKEMDVTRTAQLGREGEAAKNSALKHIEDMKEFNKTFASPEEKVQQTIAEQKEKFGAAFTPAMEAKIRASMGGLKARTAAQKDFNSSIDESTNAYKEAADAYEQLEKYGINGDKRTKAEKERIKLQTELNRLNQEGATSENNLKIAGVKQALVTNAATIEIEKKTQALKKQLEGEEALAATRAALQEELNTQRDVYKNDLATYGLSDEERKKLSATNQIKEKYDNQLKKLAFDNEKNPSANYDAQVNQIKSFKKAALKEYDDFYNKRRKQEEDWSIGASRAWNNYVESVRNVSAQTENLFSSGIKGMEDALVNFVMTGKSSFADLAQSIIAQLIRIQIQQTMTSIFGGSSGGGFGGILSAAAGGLAQGYGSFATMNAGVASSTGLSITELAGAFADGGEPPVNKPSLVGERGPEIFVPKQAGTVIPNHELGGQKVEVTYAPTIHIDSRTDRAEVQALVSKAVKNGNAQLVDDLKRAGAIR